VEGQRAMKCASDAFFRAGKYIGGIKIVRKPFIANARGSAGGSTYSGILIKRARELGVARGFARLLVAFHVACLCGIGASWAENTSGGAGEGATAELMEVVVTANKRSENLQNVPVSIAVASAVQLENAGVQDTASLSTVVSGLFMNDGITGLEPHLRGVGATNQAAGAENSVVTYIDGVPMSSPGGSLLQLNNIAQVEVDKGPQGTLFGRNATGGVINITTKDPTQQFGGTTAVAYGNYNTIATDDYITGGITSGLAADLAIHYLNQGDGYGRNLYNGEDVQKAQDLSARTKWLFTPTEDDRLKVALDYEQTHNTVAPAYRPTYGTSTNWGPGIPLPTGQPYVFTGGPWDTDVIYPASYGLKQGGASVNYQHDFGAAIFTSISAYRQSQTLYNWSVNPAPSLATLANETENEHQFTQELQLASPDASTIKWVGGLFYLQAAAQYHPFVLSGPASVPAPLDNVIWDVTQPTYSAAIFGQMSAPVPKIKNTNVTLGLRYTAERRELHGSDAVTFEPATGIPPIITPYDEHKIFDKPTWRFSVDHHFADELTAYVSYNRGFNAGAYNTLPPNPVPVRPEVLDAYEIGLKSDLLDRRLRVNTAAFFYDYTDIQVGVVQAASTTLVNGAKAHIYGIDLDAQALMTENLTVSATLELLHDEFRSFPNAQFNRPLPIQDGGGNTQEVGDAAGNKLPYTPSVTFNLSANYNVPFSYGTMDFNVTYAYADSWFPSADNIVEAPHSNLVNAQIAWALLDNHTHLKLWARNLTNQAVPMILLEHGNPGGNTEEIDAPPRTYGVTAQYKF
jgi:iron complex outermembrane recepter protein